MATVLFSKLLRVPVRPPGVPNRAGRAARPLFINNSNILQTKKLNFSRPYTTAPSSTSQKSSSQSTSTSAKKTTSTTASTQTSQQETSPVQLHEKGHIYFFYRPKVEHKEAHSVDDVKRLEIVLTPGSVKSSKSKSRNKFNRLLIVPRKVMPNIENHERYMAMIYGVSDSLDQLNEEFRKQDYSTKTRGERHQEGARAVAEGVYSIVQHGRHTHLLYSLEAPSKVGEVQKAFNIENEGSYIISVKNPTYPPTPESRQTASPSLPNLTQELVEGFEGKKWSPTVPTDLLNYSGTWILLLGAAEDLKEEFGEDSAAVKDIQDMTHKDLKALKRAGASGKKQILAEKLFDELRLDRKENPVDPMVKGKWR